MDQRHSVRRKAGERPLEQLQDGPIRDALGNIGPSGAVGIVDGTYDVGAVGASGAFGIVGIVAASGGVYRGDSVGSCYT